MNRYVIDSWAWMEYLDGSDIGRKAKVNIEGGNAFTNMVTLAEVVSRVSRGGGDADIAFNSILSLSRIIFGDIEFTKDVGQLHSAIKKSKSNFSLADAFALQTARKLHAKVLTGDPDFKGIKEAEMLK
jgi:predicted nucleic acid-binding protein